MSDHEDADGDLAQERVSIAIDDGIRVVRARVGSGALLPDERFCEECGDEIPVARVRAAPWATRCVQCQSMAERH